MENPDQTTEIRFHLAAEENTEQLAQWLAPLLTDASTGEGPGGRIHLHGDLGAGKTSFARAFLRACGVTGRIKSPSYALLETYKVSNLYFYHLDFYRFGDSKEWLDAGFRDILQKDAIVLIEWPEQAGAHLPPPDLNFFLEYAETGRTARLTAHSKRGTLWLNTLTPRLQTLPTA